MYYVYRKQYTVVYKANNILRIRMAGRLRYPENILLSNHRGISRRRPLAIIRDKWADIKRAHNIIYRYNTPTESVKPVKIDERHRSGRQRNSSYRPGKTSSRRDAGAARDRVLVMNIATVVVSRGFLKPLNRKLKTIPKFALRPVMVRRVT